MEYVCVEKVTGLELSGREVIVHIWTATPNTDPAHADPVHTIRWSVAAIHQFFQQFDQLFADPRAQQRLLQMGLIKQPQ